MAGLSRRRRPTLMLSATWTGWSRSTRRSCVRISTPPAPAARPPGAGSNHRIARPDEPPDHALGRSRGGLTTKIHGAADGRCRSLAICVTAGQVHDTTRFATVLAGIRVPRAGAGRPRTRPDRVIADKAYSSRANRTLLRRRKIGRTIPERSDQRANRRRRGRRGGRPCAFDRGTYRGRNTGSSNGGGSPPGMTRRRPTTAVGSYWPSCSPGPPHDPRDTP